MAARNNHQASKKRAAILRVLLNTVNFNRVRYLLLIKITNTVTHRQQLEVIPY